MRFLPIRLGDAVVPPPLSAPLTVLLGGHNAVTWHALVDEKSVVAQLKQQLEVGNLRPTFLYQEVATRIISEEEMIRRD